MILVWFVSSVWFLCFSELGYLLCWSLQFRQDCVRVSPLLASSFSCSSPLPQTKTGSHCLICDPRLILSLICLAQCCLAGNTVSYFNFFPLSGNVFRGTSVGILKITSNFKSRCWKTSLKAEKSIIITIHLSWLKTLLWSLIFFFQFPLALVHPCHNRISKIKSIKRFLSFWRL